MAGHAVHGHALKILCAAECRAYVLMIKKNYCDEILSLSSISTVEDHIWYHAEPVLWALLSILV